MQEEKTYQFEILDISYINGKKTPIDNYRKTLFETQEELIEYKKYIQKRLGEKLYFTTRDLRDKEPNPKGHKHLRIGFKSEVEEEIVP